MFLQGQFKIKMSEDKKAPDKKTELVLNKKEAELSESLPPMKQELENKYW